MSVDRDIYVGWYIKVWMPKEEIEYGKKCMKCGTVRHGINFCPECGKELQPRIVESMQDFAEYQNKIFSKKNMFYGYISPYEKMDFVLVMPNRKRMDWGIHIDDDGDLEYSLDIQGPALESEWFVLLSHLIEDKITYEVKYGLIYYFT